MPWGHTDELRLMSADMGQVRRREPPRGSIWVLPESGTKRIKSVKGSVISGGHSHEMYTRYAEEFVD